jgi:putative component of toxin-antitoxin plasmid stabilization module
MGLVLEIVRFQAADGRGKTLVVLLCGGTKKTQAADIELAKRYWADWKRRQP